MLGKSFDDKSPLFMQIKQRIEDLIVSGAFAVDEQIPSTTQIVQFYKINHITVAKGVNLLVDEGILYKKRGLGVFVSPKGRSILMQKRTDNFTQQFIDPLITEAKKLGIDLHQLIHLIHLQGGKHHDEPHDSH